ncbi:hypothetical protein MTO96_007166 [Rhipicephalus appendiculatus]
MSAYTSAVHHQQVRQIRSDERLEGICEQLRLLGRQQEELKARLQASRDLPPNVGAVPQLQSQLEHISTQQMQLINEQSELSKQLRRIDKFCSNAAKMQYGRLSSCSEAEKADTDDTVAEGRWAALVARQTVAPAQVQGEREAEVFGESNDEGVSGQTKEALVVEPAVNESAADLLVVPTAECAPTLGDCEETHPSPSVAFVSGATPECVGGKPSDRDNCNQGSAPRERKRLQLKPRSVPVEANQEGDAAPKAAKLAPQASSFIFGGARPVDTASREREIEARLARQREEEEHRRIRQPFQDSLKDDQVRRSSAASGSLPPRRSSESDSDSYDDGGRQPLSRQYGNDSGQHSLSSEHGPQARYDALVQRETEDSAEHPPADHIRPPDFEEKFSAYSNNSSPTLSHEAHDSPSQDSNQSSNLAQQAPPSAADVFNMKMASVKKTSAQITKQLVQETLMDEGLRVIKELASQIKSEESSNSHCATDLSSPPPRPRGRPPRLDRGDYVGTSRVVRGAPPPHPSMQNGHDRPGSNGLDLHHPNGLAPPAVDEAADAENSLNALLALSQKSLMKQEPASPATIKMD